MTEPSLGPVLSHSAGICKFSPNGKFFALCSPGGRKNRIVIKSASDYTTAHIFSCVSTISQIEWSPDSDYILCGMNAKSIVQVFSIWNPKEFSCRLTEGVAGLTHTLWAPDSRQILTIADFQLHITIWNLATNTQNVIKSPKLITQGIDFSTDERFLAVAHRKEAKDYIGIYAVHADWQRVKFFRVATTDLEAILWSPNDECIVARDNCIEYLFLVYSPTGTLISRYQAYERALGLKYCCWAPNGCFFTAGSYDEVCRVFNTVTWKPMAECEHDNKTIPTLLLQDKNHEKENEDSGNAPSLPKTVKIVKPDLTKYNPRIGIGSIAWSSESEYFATRNDNMPHTVWIWSPTHRKPVAVLEFETRVFSFKWDPARPTLAIAIGTPVIAIWSKSEGARLIKVEQNESDPVKGIRWNPNGGKIILVSKENLYPMDCAFI